MLWLNLLVPYLWDSASLQSRAKLQDELTLWTCTFLPTSPDQTSLPLHPHLSAMSEAKSLWLVDFNLVSKQKMLKCNQSNFITTLYEEEQSWQKGLELVSTLILVILIQIAKECAKDILQDNNCKVITFQKSLKIFVPILSKMSTI